MTIQISLTDLALAILIILAIVLGVYIIITLIKLNKTLNSINSMIAENSNHINSSVKNFPEITGNITSITRSVKGKTDILDQYLNKDDETAATMDIQAVLTGVTTIIELVSEIKNRFGKKNRKFYRKK